MEEPGWLVFLREMERDGRALGWTPSMGTAELLRRIQDNEQGHEPLFTKDPRFYELINKLQAMGHWRET